MLEASVAPRDVRFCGVGGTFTSLAAMRLGMEDYDFQRVQGVPLGRAWLQETSARLCALPLDARRSIPGLMSARADVIVAGSLIACALCEALAIPEVYAIDRDAIEAFLIEKIGTGEMNAI